MKKILLKKLTLSNFKSVNSDIHFHDDKTIIKGENGLGKTAQFKAWIWLWTGYTDSLNGKNHELFDNRKEITKDTPSAMVEAIISIDGSEYKIKRSASALFTRERGGVDWVKASTDKYRMFVDDIEYTATQFNEWIEANLCPLSVLPYCLDGSFFSTLTIEDKAKAKEKLDQLIDSVKDEDMNGDYSLIKELIKNKPIDLVISNARSEQKKYLKTIDSILEDIKRKKESLSSFDLQEKERIDSEIKTLQTELELTTKRMLYGEYGENNIVEERKRKIEKLNSKQLFLEEQITIFNNSQKTLYEAKNSEISHFEEWQEGVKQKIQRQEEVKEQYQKELEEIIRRYNDLKDKLAKVKETQFQSKCPYCGNIIEDMSMLEELETSFNENKRENIRTIVDEGKLVAKHIETHDKEIKKLNSEIQMLKDVLRSKTLEILQLELKAINSDYTFTHWYVSTNEEIEQLKKEIAELNSKLDVDSLQKKHTELSERISELTKQQEKFILTESVNEMIVCLEKQQRDLGNKVAELTGVINTCLDYMNEKAELVAERINKKLDKFRITMWRTQKDGTKVADCTITNDNGVKFTTMNTAQRIKANIELQMLFLNHFGLSLPTFIDESSVFNSKNLPDVANQCIYLFASDDERLVVE